MTIEENNPRPDIVDLKYNVDPNLTDDTKLQMGDNEVSYSDIKKFFSPRKQDPIRCLVYWDDICQFTSLGLIEVVNEIAKADAKIDIEHFLTRPNEYSYGIQYVYKLYEKVLNKAQIQQIKRTFYWDIMCRSLRSSLFTSILRLDTYFDRLGFYFPFPFENNLQLKTEFREIFFKNRGQDKLQFYYASDKIAFNDIIKKGGYNCVITPNISQTYEYILKNDLKRITIVGPEDHNGLTPEIYNMLFRYKLLPRPNYCEINLYREQISLVNEDI